MRKLCQICETERKWSDEFCPVCINNKERYVALQSLGNGEYYIYDTWKSETISSQIATIRLNRLESLVSDHINKQKE